MPSRRKSAHTTKIERVPRYEVYHGEEDYDDLLRGEDPIDQGLDLSMKRIKVEPMDYGDNGEDLRLHSKREAEEPREMESASSALTRMAVVVSGESVEKRMASSRDGITHSNERETIADDANNGSDSDHMSLQLNIETQSSPAECTGTEAISSNASAVNASNGSPLLSHSSKGKKKARPFKAQATNRDLLSGLATVQTTLASYSVPIALTSSATGAGPLAFASVPLVNGASMIPVSASSSATTSDASSAGDVMGAGADASSTSTSSSSTAKTTSTTRDAHLMTLADEADKILRERHESESSSSGSTQDSLEGRTAESVSSYGSEMTIGEDGSVLKIPSLGRSGSGASNGDGSNSLSFIQQRALAAAVAATNPSKSKKKRNPLPADSKDIAYWERRRKNNEAAKRSRDARRAKEDQIAIRAALLEQENIRLKIEVTALKEETVKLRAKLYSNNNSQT